MTTLTEGFPCFFLSCKANARVKPAKTGARPALFLVLLYVFLCSMYYLFCDVPCIVCVYMCTEQLPPGGYPIAVKYIIHHIISFIFRKIRNANTKSAHPFRFFNPLNPELNPICYLLTLLRAHHFLHVSRIRVKLLTFRLLMSYIYGAPILDVSRSHTTTQHSR